MLFFIHLCNALHLEGTGGLNHSTGYALFNCTDRHISGAFLHSVSFDLLWKGFQLQYEHRDGFVRVARKGELLVQPPCSERNKWGVHSLATNASIQAFLTSSCRNHDATRTDVQLGLWYRTRA